MPRDGRRSSVGVMPQDERPRHPDRAHVVIAGGGVAGIETALALADLAAGRATVELLAPEPDFVYRPLLVEEPFTGEPPPELALEPLLASVGTGLAAGTLAAVRPGGAQARAGGGRRASLRPSGRLRRRAGANGLPRRDRLRRPRVRAGRRRTRGPCRRLARGDAAPRSSAPNVVGPPSLRARSAAAPASRGARVSGSIAPAPHSGGVPVGDLRIASERGGQERC